MTSILNHLNAQCNWLKSCQILHKDSEADGAIKKYPDQGAITPYFANSAAMAMLEIPTFYPLVERYLNWYLRHLKTNGTILDYHYDENFKSQTAKPDSEDAYAGTYLSLACTYYYRSKKTTWLKKTLSSLKKIAGAIISLMDRDGLTFALADYRVKYLMDNCEAYRGLKDFATLLEHLKDRDAALCQEKADNIAAGIEKELWNPRSQCYHAAKTGRSSSNINLKNFYPDAVAQIFPALCGLITPDSERAVHLYKVFNDYQPAWVNIQPPDFPWMLLAYCAYLQGDYRRAQQKISQAAELYIKSQSGCWYCAESAFFILTCASLYRRS